MSVPGSTPPEDAPARGAPAAASSGDASPNDEVQRASERHLRQAKLGAYGVFTLGLAALVLLLSRGCAPVGVISGEVVAGRPVRVALVDVPRDIYRDGELSGTRYSVPLPPFAREPRVFVYGTEPAEHWVEGPVLPAQEGAQEAPPLSLWSTPLEIGLREGQLRFDWAPLPTGPGYPERRRYSVLLRYQRSDGEVGEVTLLCDEPKRGLPLAELHELLKEWDETKRELEIELRGYDPGEQQGAMWVGRRLLWVIPPDASARPKGE